MNRVSRRLPIVAFFALACVGFSQISFGQTTQPAGGAGTDHRLSPGSMRASPRTDANSMAAHEQLLAKAKAGRIDLYFLGDSITRRWGCTDPQWSAMYANWKRNFFGWNAADFGWGADGIQNVLWRIQNGELDGVNPKVIVILAGTNNVGTRPGDEKKVANIVGGIGEIVSTCREKAPQAKIILTAIFPRNDSMAVWPEIQRINDGIARLADGESIFYLNVNDKLANADGVLMDGMTVDRLHPTAKGYQVWADGLQPLLTKFLGPRGETDNAPPATGDPSVQAPRASSRELKIDLARDTGKPLNSTFRMSVGGDRAIIYERPTVQRDLKFVVDHCGFRYIRFHGLLNEEMKVVSAEQDGKLSYHWDHVDAVYDVLLKSGIRPFVELGFMPGPLASGKETIFYYKGNTTPPKSYEAWADLVTALVKHLGERYGVDEVKSWYFEVWNEPNLSYFWHGTQADYLHLYDVTSRAIKAVNPDYRVGGPATAGIGLAWVPELLAHCRQTASPIDFIATHLYGVKDGFLDEKGKAQLVLDPAPNAIIDSLPKLLDAIHQSNTPSIPLFITEWSSSYSSRDPVHDSYISAAYILSRLKRVPEGVAGMSYWTFSDQFEENGLVPSPFHGGFGLLNAQGLPKPAFFAYQFLNQMDSRELACEDADAIATSTSDGGVKVLLWNYTPPKQDRANQTFYTRDWPASATAPANVHLLNVAAGDYMLSVYRVGYRHNDVYTAYVDAGKPAGIAGDPGLLDQDHFEKLKAASSGQADSVSTVHVNADGKFDLKLPMDENEVCFVKLDGKK